MFVIVSFVDSVLSFDHWSVELNLSSDTPTVHYFICDRMLLFHVFFWPKMCKLSLKNQKTRDNFTQVVHRRFFLDCWSDFLDLLFFAVYEIYKKNYSFSRVVLLFPFFIWPKWPTFFSKINDSGRRRTARFSSSRLGVRATALPKIFTTYPWHLSTPEINEILRGSLRKFSALWDKKFCDGKSWHYPPPPTLSSKLFRCPKLMKDQKVPLRHFSALWDKNFWKEILILPPPSYP